MRTIEVNATRRYEVHVGNGLLEQTGALAAPLIRGRRGVIVSDSRVFPLYGDRLATSLTAAGFSVCSYVFPEGEASKNTQTLVSLLNFLANEQITRSDALFALGGGVTGDLTGLAAATYQRGMACVQVPTTLLAAVDASVGGKTAVNLDAGKNLMGAFFQPYLVVCDPTLTQTLPPEVFADGCAEVIKYGMIASDQLLGRLRGPLVGEVLEAVIADCIAIKRDLVTRDEFDTGERQLLNFGHTVGHAIERCSNFGISHGSAVAIGMAVITRACVAEGRCERGCASLLLELLARFGLPDRCEYTSQELLEAARSDKKRSGERITLVLPERPGRCVLESCDYPTLLSMLEKGGAV